MRCALVCDTYYPEKNSAANLLSDLVKFSSNNLNVIYDVYTVGTDQKSVGDKVRILNYKKKLKNKSYIVRALFEIYSGIYFCFLHMRYRRQVKYDAVIFYNPTILQIFFLIYLKRRYPKAVFVLLLRDIFPDWAVELGLIRSTLLKKVLYRVKEWNIKIADLVYCESSNKLEHIKKEFPNTKVQLLYNWTYFSPLENSFKKKEKKQFIYAGNVGEAQDIKSCVTFLQNLIAVGHTIDFYSEGSELKELRAAFETNDSINFFKPVAFEQLEILLPRYDGGLVFLAQGLKFDNIPGKILSYLRHGLPIFGTVNFGNEILTMVNSNSLGALVDSRVTLGSAEYRVKMLKLCNRLNREKIHSKAMIMFSVETAAKRIIEDLEILKREKI